MHSSDGISAFAMTVAKVIVREAVSWKLRLQRAIVGNSTHQQDVMHTINPSIRARE